MEPLSVRGDDSDGGCDDILDYWGGDTNDDLATGIQKSFTRTLTQLGVLTSLTTWNRYSTFVILMLLLLLLLLMLLLMLLTMV